MTSKYHNDEEWPYHEDKYGNMVPCASNPCRRHPADIMATSPEDAAARMHAVSGNRPSLSKRHDAVNNDNSVNDANNVSVLDSLNPTGTVFIEHDPSARAIAPLGGTLTTLAVTTGHDPDDRVMIYRGAPAGITDPIKPGDFITTNMMLARDYAGNGVVTSMNTRYGDILDDSDDPEGEEYLYRPGADAELKNKTDISLQTKNN